MNSACEAIVALPLQDPEGRIRDVEAVVDTVHSGFLTLPPGLVAELGLPFAYIGQALLANDAEVDFDVHHVTVLWDGQPGTSGPTLRAAPRSPVCCCSMGTA